MLSRQSSRRLPVSLWSPWRTPDVLQRAASHRDQYPHPEMRVYAKPVPKRRPRTLSPKAEITKKLEKPENKKRKRRGTGTRQGQPSRQLIFMSCQVNTSIRESKSKKRERENHPRARRIPIPIPKTRISKIESNPIQSNQKKERKKEKALSRAHSPPLQIAPPEPPEPKRTDADDAGEDERAPGPAERQVALVLDGLVPARRGHVPVCVSRLAKELGMGLDG